MKTDILVNGSMVKIHISSKKKIRIQCNTENFVPVVVPGFLQFSSFNFKDTFKTGEALFYIFFKLVFFNNDINIK